ncbi:uncharacterized protein KY384_003148 [Bacidia gigantensis]|uniref:uncharacterized protein n=1 Tax=Bacidia gigantensis TaxID=2732470 RepID=UPI001D040F50|nr:uncharacterized protein KY384_003148 [Bacidia gigantensis]KAG8531519.1 hypothetical protein KY384_003148 [Bacidia gigantensis]
MIDPPPRAPTPPPAWRSGLEPKIIERKPREELLKNKKRKEPKKIILHYPDHSSDDDDDSSDSPEPTREHERPRRRHSLSPATRSSVEKKLREEKERRERAENAADAEREARLRAEQDHEGEMRRERRRRIGNNTRQPLESAEGLRRRQSREQIERSERARRRQREEDIDHIRRNERRRSAEMQSLRNDQHHLDRLIPTQPRQHPVAVHHGPGDIQERGNGFLSNAVHQAAQRREDEAHSGRGQEGGVRRRESFHEDRPRRSYERRRPRGRHGGSG